jgi:hypothetical protein
MPESFEGIFLRFQSKINDIEGGSGGSEMQKLLPLPLHDVPDASRQKVITSTTNYTNYTDYKKAHP